MHRDVIDHEPADGNIYKMILGSLDDRYDDEQTDTVTGDDVGNALLREDRDEYDESIGSMEVHGSVRKPGSKSSKYVRYSGAAFNTPQAQTFNVGILSKEPGSIR